MVIFELSLVKIQSSLTRKKQAESFTPLQVHIFLLGVKIEGSVDWNSLYRNVKGLSIELKLKTLKNSQISNSNWVN